MVVENFVSALAGEVWFDYLVNEEPIFQGHNLPGNRCFIIPKKSRSPLSYRSAIRKHFERHYSEYSAVWLNANNLSNIDSLKLAKKYGIPKRIVHAHSGKWLGGVAQKAMSEIHRYRLDNWVSDKWACSKTAGDFFYGESDYRIVPNAIDMEAYAFSGRKRSMVRARYGLDSRFVIGTVGRLAPEKRHEWIIELMPTILQVVPNAVFLIVGDGSEEERLRALASSRRVSEAVVFAGSQGDVQAYLSSFDVFVLPSLFEGLPLSLLEAQANGLPCVVSDKVDGDAFISSSVGVAGLEDRDSWVDLIVRSSREAFSFTDEKAAAFDLKSQAVLLKGLFAAQ